MCGNKILVEKYWGVAYPLTGTEGINLKQQYQERLEQQCQEVQSLVKSVVKGLTPSEAQPVPAAGNQPSRKQCQPTKMKKAVFKSPIEIPKPKGIQVGIRDKVQYILREFPHWLSLDRYLFYVL